MKGRIALLEKRVAAMEPVVKGRQGFDLERDIAKYERLAAAFLAKVKVSGRYSTPITEKQAIEDMVAAGIAREDAARYLDMSVSEIQQSFEEVSSNGH